MLGDTKPVGGGDRQLCLDRLTLLVWRELQRPVDGVPVIVQHDLLREAGLPRRVDGEVVGPQHVYLLVDNS